MKFYEYDASGWLVGWYEAETPRPNSTQTPPLSPAVRSRWVGGAWTLDSSREIAEDNERSAMLTARQQAFAALRNYDPATATAAEVRATLGAVVKVLLHTAKGEG